MTLPTPILEKIFGNAPILMERRAGEKRRKGRFPYSIAAKLCLLDGAKVAKPISVRVRDLSGDGIGIMRSAPMRIAERFMIGLPQKNSDAAWIDCQVVRSQFLGGGLYMVGATFNTILQGCPYSAASVPTPNGESEIVRIRKAILS